MFILPSVLLACEKLFRKTSRGWIFKQAAAPEKKA
jgi:hypothetical protein